MVIVSGRGDDNSIFIHKVSGSCLLFAIHACILLVLRFVGYCKRTFYLQCYLSFVMLSFAVKL